MLFLSKSSLYELLILDRVSYTFGVRLPLSIYIFHQLIAERSSKMHTPDKRYGLHIFVENEQAPEYLYHESTFIEGPRGARFTIGLSNDTDRQVYALMSVDGVSPRTSRPVSSTSGYIIAREGTQTLYGWNEKGQEDCSPSPFLFGKLPKTDDARDSGIIAVTFHREVTLQPFAETKIVADNYFEVEGTLFDITGQDLQVYYDTDRGLLRRGIPFQGDTYP